jgi:hypothetical protein
LKDNAAPCLRQVRQSVSWPASQPPWIRLNIKGWTFEGGCATSSMTVKNAALLALIGTILEMALCPVV